MSGLDLGRAVVRALRHRWPLVLAFVLPALVVSVWYVETRPGTTTAVAVVGVEPESVETISTDAVTLALGRYGVAATAPGTLAEVQDASGIPAEALESSVEVTPSTEAGNLTVRVEAPAADEALRAADAVAAAIVEQGQADPLANARVLAEAAEESPGLLGSPRFLELVLAAVLLALGVLLAVALEVLRPVVRTGADAARAAGAPFVGNLPQLVRTRPRRAVAPEATILAAARTLRAGFGATTGSVPDGPVAVVPVRPGAGASTVTFLLGRSLTDAGRRCLVVDLDLDQAALSRTLSSGGGRELLDVLEESVDLREAVRSEGGVPVLQGRPSSGIDDLVERRLPDVLRKAGKTHDVVLCDVAPLGAGEVSEVVAVHASSVLLVVSRGDRWGDVALAVERLARLGVPVRGVALNRATRFEAEQPALTTVVSA